MSTGKLSMVIDPPVEIHLLFIVDSMNVVYLQSKVVFSVFLFFLFNIFCFCISHVTKNKVKIKQYGQIIN
jgi:hypothetical protein